MSLWGFCNNGFCRFWGVRNPESDIQVISSMFFLIFKFKEEDKNLQKIWQIWSKFWKTITPQDLWDLLFQLCKDHPQVYFYTQAKNMQEGRWKHMGGIRKDVKRLKMWNVYPLFFRFSWPFTFTFLDHALMKLTICFKQLEASHIMSWDSLY